MKKIAVAGLLTAMMSAASAQLYVGASLGQGHYSFKVDCSPANVKCDDTGTGKKLYIGYQITPVLAWEGTYFSFGKASVKGPGGKAQLEATAVGVGMAARVTVVDGLALVGRLGLATVEAKGKLTTASSLASDSTSSPQVYAGFGAEYSLTNKLKAVATADFTRAETDDGSGDLRLLNVGLQYSF